MVYTHILYIYIYIYRKLEIDNLVLSSLLLPSIPIIYLVVKKVYQVFRPELERFIYLLKQLT